MIGFYLKAFVILTCLSIILLVGAEAIAPIDNHLDSFMIAMENCGGVCLFSIQPGKTTVGETMTHLRDHIWVGDVNQNAPGNGYAQITWEWSGQQPNSIDDNRQGRVTFYWDVEDTSGLTLRDSIVETVSVYTHVRMYSFQERLGKTEKGNVNNRADGTLGYTAIYDIPGSMISVVAEMRCPVTIVSYWNARARMMVSVGRSDSPYVDPSEMVQMC
jgi:hypothetical protein